MLFMMRFTVCSSALPCNVCRFDMLPWLLLLKTPCSLFMWQRGIAEVAHYIMDLFQVLAAIDDAPDDTSTSVSSALALG